MPWNLESDELAFKILQKLKEQNSQVDITESQDFITNPQTGKPYMYKVILEKISLLEYCECLESRKEGRRKLIKISSRGERVLEAMKKIQLIDPDPRKLTDLILVLTEGRVSKTLKDEKEALVKRLKQEWGIDA